MTLTETLAALTNGTTTPSQLVDEAIERIEAQQHLNAVVSTRFNQARLEATRDYSKTQFKGIPILIKSLGQDLKGEPSTAASFRFKDQHAAKTSPFVKKIEDLGFIILGQTNAPELGFKNITDSKLYGDCPHPFHLEHSAGGSSGGAASALASNLVSIVAASDGGGSIRIPASYLGLIGLKPSRGSMPGAPRSWQGAAINFFITKSIADTRLIFDAMKQDNGPFHYLEKPRIKKQYRIAYALTSPVGLPISKDAEKALLKTVKHLQDLGHIVEQDQPAIDGPALMHAYYVVNGAETAALLDDEGNLELTTQVILRYGKTLTAADLVRALQTWDHAQATLNRFFETYDFYLTPTTADTAPRIDTRYQSKTLLEEMKTANDATVVWDMFELSLAKTPYCMLANMTGHPAITYPLYKNEKGFHLGSQFIAATGNEAGLFDLGEQLSPYFE